MKGKKIITLFVFVTFIILLLSLHIGVANAQMPQIPHAFYGTLTVNNEPAAIETQVEVRGAGVLIGIDNNPMITTEIGRYGSDSPFGSKLVAQGEIADGTILEFYVDGVFTGQTWVWHSGEVTKFDLTVTIPLTEPTLPVELNKELVSWSVIGSVIAGTLIIGLLVFLIRRRAQ